MTFRKTLATAIIGGCVACGSLFAGSCTVPVPDLPDGYCLSMSLNNGGVVNGAPGDALPFFFSLDWTSTNGHWLLFTSSAASQPVLGTYSSIVQFAGGNSDGAVAPAGTTFADSTVADGHWDFLTGAYQIDPGAGGGGQETGNIQVFFNLYDNDPFGGDPMNPFSTTQGLPVGDGSFEVDLAYTLNIDAPPLPDTSDTPEPATWGLLLCGAALIAAVQRLAPNRAS